MQRQLPNLLTIGRLVLAALFFVVLNRYRYGEGDGDLVLTGAIALFLLAAITDWLDGYLARRWKVESTFGRIMDPFCDKVLVLGAFIYLAGPRFVDPTRVENDPGVFGILPGNMVSGFYPWMVALMLARELLVTGIRGELERLGVKFGANIWGKAKTTTQLTVVPIVLLIVAMDPNVVGNGWMAYVRDVLVYATVIFTVGSGIPYITAARRVLAGHDDVGKVAATKAEHDPTEPHEAPTDTHQPGKQDSKLPNG